MVLILDNKKIKSRKIRGFWGITAMGLNAIGAAAGLIGWLYHNDVDRITEPPAWDWTDPQFSGLFVLYIMFGATYSGYQLQTEWTLAATTNDPELLSKIAAIFKFWSSLGMFISFIVSGQQISFYAQTSIQLV